MKTTLIAAALALASFSAISSAQADNWSNTAPQVNVPYGDLNLSSPAGAQSMLNRIKAAASHVCGGSPDNRDISGKRFYRSCVKLATDTAVAQVSAPLVTALHTGRPITDTRFAKGGSK